jgi:protein-disulfide isomerase
LYGGAVELDLAELPLVGEPGAPVVMVSLHDYGCHHCRIMHHHLAQVRRQWSNQVAIVNLVMPLDPKCNYTVKRTHPDHVNSCEYARTALAVWRAAPAAMEHFDDWIFTSERPPPPAEVTAYAAQLVGTNALQQALRDPWIDRQLLKNIHIYATNYLHYHQGSMPQLIIGSNVVVGALGSPADLDSLLAKQPGVRLALPTK